MILTELLSRERKRAGVFPKTFKHPLVSYKMSLKAEGGLSIRMKRSEKLRLEQMRALLEASQEVCFTGHSRSDIYDWAGKTLREHDYAKQGREVTGLLRSYGAKPSAGDTEDPGFKDIPELLAVRSLSTGLSVARLPMGL